MKKHDIFARKHKLSPEYPTQSALLIAAQRARDNGFHYLCGALMALWSKRNTQK